MSRLVPLMWLSAASALSVSAQPINFVMGTQAIYGPGDNVYNFTGEDALTEQTRAAVRMGSNQFKLRLAPKTTCSGYHLRCANSKGGITSLKQLTQEPEVAAAFGMPQIMWYQFWMYSYSNDNFLGHDWTEMMVEAEYNETKEWATHMLVTYSGSGKVFMAGNWEGDWALMGASGCKQAGKYNMSCDPTAKVIERMVKWGNARQRAIDDAQAEAEATGRAKNVTLAYYIEMNLGPEAVLGKPGVTNDVLPKINPDFVSYSSYSATNAYAKDSTADDVAATDAALRKVLDHVVSKLPPKKTGAVARLGLGRRLFIGEYGSHAHNDNGVVTFVARVAHAAIGWGVPFVLYWELYDNDSTSPIVPKSGKPTALYQLFRHYYIAARAFTEQHTRLPSPLEFHSWAAAYFRTAANPSCTFEVNTTYEIQAAGEGYEKGGVESKQQCCAVCAADPSCVVAVFSTRTCYVRYTMDGKQTGDGVACVKRQAHQAAAQGH